MTKSQILEKFMQEVDDELLKKLLGIYNQSLDLSEDERVSKLVEELEKLIEERSNATKQP